MHNDLHGGTDRGIDQGKCGQLFVKGLTVKFAQLRYQGDGSALNTPIGAGPHTRSIMLNNLGTNFPRH